MAYDIIQKTSFNIPPAGYRTNFTDWEEEIEYNIYTSVRLKGRIVASKKVKSNSHGIIGAYSTFTFLIKVDNGPYEDYESARLMFEVI